ncbi:hypothetical protein EUTSA_v10013853mg [Eutrema salsugineum]|uniref:KIB1-4 beta-propeller domain-containing protein n=1 Tax=Eutrema salsugineum TaxID=72664 RepID=V4N4E6_EUTSA|nr:uncharacterized protein LOC18019423 [Eutrema salsugineum]ESQ40241.1 hypothetical protein EUTSA_v10013853mg [Eutrema salsugineum]
MSQLLGRIAKLSTSSPIGKQPRLCFSELRALTTEATPYLLFQEINGRRAPCGNEMLVDMNLYDPRKDERVKIPDQTLSMELLYSVRIGSSSGWVAGKNIHDSTVRLTNMFNPCASVSSRKVISLPPWDDESRGRAVSSISLSASPDQQGCVVAAKTPSSSLSLCRPGDSEWTHVRVPFYASEMTYSARDRKFYLHMLAREQVYDGPIDLIDTSSGFPQVSLYQRFPLSDIPKSRQDQVNSTYKTQHQVESPSGDSFIVYWCNEFLNREEMESIRAKEPTDRIFHKLRGFLVFRQDNEQRIASYTEDIGDLCIFLSNSEAFCVSATDYPGLHPNSVYYASSRTGFGFYDLSSNTLHDVIDEAPFSMYYHWLAPLQ